MPPLFVFLIAYAGIGGKNVAKIDDQVHAMIAKSTKVAEIKLSRRERRALINHTEDAETLVRELDVAGVIAGEVERKRNGATLTVVVYGSDGILIDLIEIPLKKRAKKLGRGDLSSLRDTIKPDIKRLTAGPPSATVAKEEPPPEPEPEVAPEPEPEPAAPPPKPAKEVAAAISPTDGTDDEEAPGLVTKKEAPAPGPTRKTKSREPLFRVAFGGGMRSRAFDPGPGEAVAYNSQGVPAAQVAMEVRPIRFVAIAGHVDRTVVMYSTLGSENAPTNMLGWQGTLAMRLPLGPVELALLGGVGSRSFTISSSTPAPTPNLSYTHAVAGGQLTVRLGKRIELRGFGAYEPVVAFQDPMAPADADRAGVAFGGSVAVSAAKHIYFLLDAAYQKFTTTWAEGSATDAYPTANASVGIQY
jgi:hypothetical protein